MEEKSKRDEVIEVVNKLFIYTDHQKWANLLDEVFMESVWFDSSSLGGGDAKELPAREICNLWQQGFEGIDAIHHQAGNFLVKFKEEVSAELYCYAIALHFKESAVMGKTREFVGSYDIRLALTDVGWRINGFTYTVKFITGNADLK